MVLSLREGGSEVGEGGCDFAVWLESDEGEQMICGVGFRIISHLTIQFYLL